NGYGWFTMGEFTAPARMRVERDGYEPAEADADHLGIDLPIQRIVRLTAGETVQPPRLAPNDLAYIVNASGSRCFPCRMIRINVPARGTLHLHLAWSGN